MVYSHENNKSHLSDFLLNILYMSLILSFRTLSMIFFPDFYWPLKVVGNGNDKLKNEIIVSFMTVYEYSNSIIICKVSFHGQICYKYFIIIYN